jgi:hypothetical protein
MTKNIPCMVCSVPANCRKAGQCLAFTERQDPEEVKKCTCALPHHTPMWWCAVHGEVTVPMD